MERRFTSYVTREMRTKAMRHYYMPNGIAGAGTPSHQMQQKSLLVLAGMQNATVTVEDSVAASYRTEHALTL